ncbi:hypothetical protein [Cloacibacterium sp.]|uniref:hypothetical protein n=1 Tax=Cloacibacterium sp. TaxID=1913682 RepID=UPI0039E4459C
MIVEIQNYIKISNSIDEILKNSPFKLKFIIEKTGISEPSFFRKMREKKFSAEELLKIAEVIAPEEALLNSLQEAEEDFEKGNYYTHQDVLENSKNRFLSKYGN